MGRVFKPTYTTPTRTGRKSVQVKDWYIEYRNEHNKQVRAKIGPDKRIATQALAEAERRVVLVNAGLPDPNKKPARLTLNDIREEYSRILEGRELDETYRTNTAASLARLCESRRWHVFTDITADDLTMFLGGLRKKKNRSPATLNGYIRTAKAFTAWVAKKHKIEDPLAGFKFYSEAVDRRRTQRVLSLDELGKLLKATEVATKRGRQLHTGRQRAALYRVAAYTGLRASELASLTPEHFKLDTNPPIVTIKAADSKAKREESVPLQDHLVVFLREFLKDIPPKVPLWPGSWAEQKHQAGWLKTDCKRAGIETVLFHGLRATYITWLVEEGADPKTLQALARHVDPAFTLRVYARVNTARTASTANKLKAPES